MLLFTKKGSHKYTTQNIAVKKSQIYILLPHTKPVKLPSLSGLNVGSIISCNGSQRRFKNI
jgi:hypothetical protein